MLEKIFEFENPEFSGVLHTLAGWGLAYIVLWIISRFFIVKKNALQRAGSLLKKALGPLADVASKCSDNSLPLVEDAVKELRKTKKFLLKADKMISVYQYDHSELMNLGGLRDDITAASKLCENLAGVIKQNDNKAAMRIVKKIHDSCEELIGKIAETQASQSQNDLLRV